MLDNIIMTCCRQFTTNRSTSAIYHLLTGKRSIQTVQDAHIFQLHQFYGIYRDLTKYDFHRRLDRLAAKNMLLQNEDGTAIPLITNQRKEDGYMAEMAAYFNGLRYYTIGEVFFDRLILLVQTITNGYKKNMNFIPLIDKPIVTSWVRNQYAIFKRNKYAYLQQMHDELYSLLQHFSDNEASLFVDCLTGYQHYGMSRFQLAQKYGIERMDIPLVLTAIVHRMLTIMEQNKEFPLLSQLTNNLPQNLNITNSAKQTQRLLNKNYKVDEIASIRELKINTIYDHLVELALHDNYFPIYDYVTYQQQQEILQASNRLKSYKLKLIKENISEDISYFQIRLVLAADNLCKGDEGAHKNT